MLTSIGEAFKRVGYLIVNVVVATCILIVGILAGDKFVLEASRGLLWISAGISVIKTVGWMTSDGKRQSSNSKKKLYTTFVASAPYILLLFTKYNSLYGEVDSSDVKQTLTTTITEAADGTKTTTRQMTTFGQWTTLEFIISVFLPLIVILACVVIVSFGHAIKAGFANKAAMRKRKERKERKIQKVLDKEEISERTATARLNTANREAAVTAAEVKTKQLKNTALKAKVASVTQIPSAVVGGVGQGLIEGANLDTRKLNEYVSPEDEQAHVKALQDMRKQLEDHSSQAAQ